MARPPLAPPALTAPFNPFSAPSSNHTHTHTRPTRDACDCVLSRRTSWSAVRRPPAFRRREWSGVGEPIGNDIVQSQADRPLSSHRPHAATLAGCRRHELAGRCCPRNFAGLLLCQGTACAGRRAGRVKRNGTNELRNIHNKHRLLAHNRTPYVCRTLACRSSWLKEPWEGYGLSPEPTVPPRSTDSPWYIDPDGVQQGDGVRFAFGVGGKMNKKTM